MPRGIAREVQVLSRDCVGGTPGAKHVEDGGVGQRIGIIVPSLHGLELLARNRRRIHYCARSFAGALAKYSMGQGGSV